MSISTDGSEKSTKRKTRGTPSITIQLEKHISYRFTIHDMAMVNACILLVRPRGKVFINMTRNGGVFFMEMGGQPKAVRVLEEIIDDIRANHISKVIPLPKWVFAYLRQLKFQQIASDMGCEITALELQTAVAISGSRDDVQAAALEIKAYKKDCSQTMNVAGHDVASIYGQKGATIRALQSATQCRISVPKYDKSDTVVSIAITGPPEEIEDVRERIQAAIDEGKEYREKCTQTMVVDCDDIATIIGKGGQTFRSIINRSKPCSIQMPDKSQVERQRRRGGVCTIKLTCPQDPRMPHTARQLIEQVIGKKMQNTADYQQRRAQYAVEKEQRRAAKERRTREYLARKAERQRRKAAAAERRRYRAMYECLEENTVLVARRGGSTVSLPARDVKEGDSLWDGSAFTLVKVATLHKARELITVKLSSGVEITATPNHVMLFVDSSEARLDATSVGDILASEGADVVRVEYVGRAFGRPMELNTESGEICVGDVIVGDSARRCTPGKTMGSANCQVLSNCHTILA